MKEASGELFLIGQREARNYEPQPSIIRPLIETDREEDRIEDRISFCLKLQPMC